VNEEVEYVVVGAGLLGLASALALARRGSEVLALESDHVGHAGSGSKGSARIFRLGYEDPFYVRLARTAKPMWRDLEHESRITLLRSTGQLSFGPGVDALRAAMTDAGAPFEDLDREETARRVPEIRAGAPAIFEPESGVLLADSCLSALRECGESTGVSLREHVPVKSVADCTDRVEIVTDSGTISASVAIICAGHRTAPLLNGAGINLKLSPTLEQVAYVSPIPECPSEVPVFIEYRDPPAFYGLPSGSGRLLKVALHGAGDTAEPQASPLESDEGLLARIAEDTGRLLPYHDPRPVSIERCFYDTSPDGDFVLDRVGRIAIGAGTTGHGFKFGPLLGEVLADLATGAEPRIELERFSARRPSLRA
jgi:sarcosine oxidase